MSHPTFLNSAPHPRMPDGSRNEWKDFWGDGPELEANAMLPLLWLALFRQSDIAWARLADDEDMDSEGRADLEELGDATYPYLVAPIADALATYNKRRPMLAALLGERLAPIVDAFGVYVRERYAPYVLLRTSGLPDVQESGDSLHQALAELDALAPAVAAPTQGYVATEIAMVHQYRDMDPVYLLSGRDGTTWPSAAMTEEFAGKPAAPQTESAAHTPRSFKNAVLGWLPALVIGAATVATYAYTNSAWAAGGCFAVVCALCIWAMR